MGHLHYTCGSPRGRALVIPGMARHFRNALRLFVRQPLFTLTAVLSLAIGIGANATIFSVANAILLAPTAAVDAPDRIVDVGLTRSNSSFDTMSYPNFEDMRRRNRTLTDMYALDFEPKALSLGGEDGATRIYAQMVSAGFFDVLGVKPALGGFFHASQEQVGTPLRQLVLSHAFWKRQFGADPHIAGRDVVINGDHFTIAAVTPEGFQGTTIISPDAWVPLTSHARGLPTESMMRGRQNQWLVAGGRLKPGVTLADARRDLTSIIRDLRQEFPDAIGGDMAAAVAPMSRVPGEAGELVTPIVGVLAVIVGMVLLLACTNLAGLLLARAAGRSREMAVRVALGASRRNLVAQLLAESTVLFVAGGIAASLLAVWMTGLLWSMLPSLPVPVSVALTFDWRVAAFTFGLAIAAGVLTGLVPALSASRLDLASSIKMDQAAPRRQRLRHVLVAAQMGLCLTLLVVAGLLLRSLGAAAAVDPGMRVDGVDVASVDLALGNYADDASPVITERIRAALRAMPGVSSVSVAAMVPLNGGGLGLGMLRPKGAIDERSTVQADWNVISPEFLPAAEIPIVRGRNFGAEDRAGGTRAAIVNEQFAASVWPGEDPIGKQLENGDFRKGRESSINTLTVVGVARNAKYRWVGEAPRSFIYVALSQEPWRRPQFFIARDRRADMAADMTTAVRQTLRSIDPNLPLIQLQQMRSLAALGVLPQMIAASVAGSLGVLALLLAAIGLYGVMAYAVTRRTREIGVRMALGADHAHVVRMVLAQGLRLTLFGGVGGLVLAVAAGMGLSSAGILFGVSALDPVSFTVTALALTGVAMLATYIPARRAARVDPLTALRTD
ncbi:MAG: ABC transporter permease [Acidobacteria bacterium]|nr:MAG: ABC transporter permease [Acidobacteriota bacterium]